MKKHLLRMKSARTRFLPSVFNLFIFFLFVVILTPGCTKKIEEVITVPNEETQNGPIPPYVFDWETTTYMPSTATSNPIPMPWNSGTTAIDPNLASDYKKIDGWELVWNTFSPTTQLNDPNYTYFFALYNKYRGVLRFYLWQTATPIATSYINHGLSLYGSTSSSMLNYNTVDIVDPSVNQTTFAQILNQQLTASGGTWLAFQYEIAYDPNIVNTSFPTFGLTWKPQWVNISNIELNGTLTGSIQGYVGNPSQSTFNLGSKLMQGGITFLGGLNYSQLLGVVDSGKNSESDPYSTALNEALGGIVKGFLNGILGGRTAGPAPVNLTIKTDIKLGGTIVNNGGLTDKKLVLPGQSNSQTADGNTPYYNGTMGIMNISSKPTINLMIEGPMPNGIVNDSWGNEYMESGYRGTFTLDNNSFSILWNPSIINSSPTGATIENLKIQIVNMEVAPMPFGDGSGGYVSIPAGFVQSWQPSIVVYNGTFDQIENIGNYAAVSSISGSPLQLYSISTAFGTIGTCVRISFDVVPNNGGPRSKIVKSFKPNIITTGP